jgi:hypothetical protein
MDLLADVECLVDALTCSRPDENPFSLAFIAVAIPSDDVLWTDVRLDNVGTTVQRKTAGRDDQLAGALARHGQDHPAIQSYVASHELSPRGISDVCADRARLNSQVYAVTFASSRERFQLSIVVQMRPPTQGHGWILTSSERDFTDAEWGTAARLQPLMVALDKLANVGEVGAIPPYALTARQTQVLDRLALDATARPGCTFSGQTARNVAIRQDGFVRPGWRLKWLQR